ncbi:MAG TPA: S41 family peptidase [Gemmatimonadales bacterium]|nr:S41 family peptidase [Gemmatimonadales bacterium]
MSRRPAVALAAALLLAAQRPGVAQTRSAYEELQTFSGVLNHVRLNYVDSVGYAQLVSAAIDGMLRSLDPHSHFYSRLEAERFDLLQRGTLAVTGISLEEVDSAVTVLAVATQSPAAKSGVQPGDRLVSLNDTSVAGLSVSTLELRLAGEKGSKVRLRLERGPRLEPDTLDISVKRDFLTVHSVSVVRMLDSITGFVRLEEFGPEAAKEMHTALDHLNGLHMRRAILDLRSNPGGIVTSAVEVASEFFPKGTVIFRTEGRKRDVDTTYSTKRDGAFATLPLIVLIDDHSASAAEALAGSLQDHDRALLLGRRSFGKALMQTGFVVPPGGEVLMLTIGHVLSPSGRFIQRRYTGLATEQYYSLAGQGGTAEDTLKVYHTDHGRVVRGGGGIAPDAPLPRPAPLPVWWSVAADSGFDNAVADSVALSLPATPAARTAWLAAPERWRTTLLPLFLSRVRTRLRVPAQTDSALDVRLSRILAARVAEVRWGLDAYDDFVARSSPDVQAAIGYFPRLHELLAAP